LSMDPVVVGGGAGRARWISPGREHAYCTKPTETVK